jgi:hypothetical protein
LVDLNQSNEGKIMEDKTENTEKQSSNETSQEDNQPKGTQISGKTALIIMAVAFVLMFFFVFIPVSKHASKPQRHDGPFEAQVMAQQFVKDGLKSPSTAHFGYTGQLLDNIKRLDDGTFVVKGWVDAQNSFGAIIRTHYVLKLKYVGSQNWRLLDQQYFNQ